MHYNVLFEVYKSGINLVNTGLRGGKICMKWDDSLVFVETDDLPQGGAMHALTNFCVICVC